MTIGMLLISRSAATSAFAGAVAIVAGVMNYILTEHGIGIMASAVAALASSGAVAVHIVVDVAHRAMLAYRAAGGGPGRRA